MTLPETLQATPKLPLDRDGDPVFTAPWEAKVFAMTVKAHETGIFTWPEWAETLGAELAKDGDGSAGELGYYDHWLLAFEKILTQKGIADSGMLSELRKAWDKAAKSTPHGQPIELNR